MLGYGMKLDALGTALLLTSSVGENPWYESLFLPSSYSYSYSSPSYHVSSSHFLAFPVLFLRSILCLAPAWQFSHTSASHLSIGFLAGLLSPRLIFTIRFRILLSNILTTYYWGKYTFGLPLPSSLISSHQYLVGIVSFEAPHYSGFFRRLFQVEMFPSTSNSADTYHVTSSSTMKD